MGRDTIFLFRAELWRLLRVRETIVWTFVMPLFFIYFIGSISGGSRDGRDGIGVFVPADAGPLADQLIGELQHRDFQVFRVSAGELDGFYRRLEIPAGFTEAVQHGNPIAVHYTRTGGDLSADFDRVRIGRAVAALGRPIAPLATIDVQYAGRRARPPAGFDQAAPGIMVMFTLTVLFTVGGISLVIERNKGIFRRLASAPMSRGSVVLGMWSARMGLGLIQIAYAMVASTILFHVHWRPHLPAIALVLFAYAALATALGMLLGNFCNTDGQAIGFGVMASNILAGLGGCWWPIEIAPAWSQKLALVLPTGITMDALHKLMSFGAPPLAVGVHVAVLATAALALGWLLARTFRFNS
jgi:ABC-type multidrug transport system permease subunit